MRNPAIRFPTSGVLWKVKQRVKPRENLKRLRDSLNQNQ